LYNVALEHRRSVYKASGKGVTYIEQANELPALKKDFPWYQEIYGQILQDVLRRVDKAFFGRVKRGDKPGFPRFKHKDRFDSFTYPQNGFKIESNIVSGKKKISLSSIGEVRIVHHREIPDEASIKTCTLKREGRKWYAVLTFDIANVNTRKKSVSTAIGVDLGIENFAFLSNGTSIENPRHLKNSEDRLKKIQSEYSIKKTKKSKLVMIKLHRKVANQRNDFLHKTSRCLVNNFDLIAYEDLNIKNMLKDNKYNLEKHILDAGWGKFISMINYKAEEAGSYAIAINPKNTSQKCSRCGTFVKKELGTRWHDCPVCSLSIHRDYNSSLSILTSGTEALRLLKDAS
jgi:putative transposase